jgi:hypothetical protein
VVPRPFDLTGADPRLCYRRLRPWELGRLLGCSSRDVMRAVLRKRLPAWCLPTGQDRPRYTFRLDWGETLEFLAGHPDVAADLKTTAADAGALLAEWRPVVQAEIERWKEFRDGQGWRDAAGARG